MDNKRQKVQDIWKEDLTDVKRIKQIILFLQKHAITGKINPTYIKRNLFLQGAK
jgi:hypothetical protein